MPLYLSDSDGTEVLDFGGTVRLITLVGIYVDTSEDNVQTFIESVEDLINGAQDNSNNAPYTFTDDRRTNSNRDSVKVKILDFESMFIAGWPLGCTWRLKLVEASENA